MYGYFVRNFKGNFWNSTQNILPIPVFEIVLNALVDIRSTNELTYGGLV